MLGNMPSNQAISNKANNLIYSPAAGNSAKEDAKTGDKFLSDIAENATSGDMEKKLARLAQSAVKDKGGPIRTPDAGESQYEGFQHLQAIKNNTDDKNINLFASVADRASMCFAGANNKSETGVQIQGIAFEMLKEGLNGSPDKFLADFGLKIAEKATEPHNSMSPEMVSYVGMIVLDYIKKYSTDEEKKTLAGKAFADASYYSCNGKDEDAIKIEKAAFQILK